MASATRTSSCPGVASNGLCSQLRTTWRGAAPGRICHQTRPQPEGSSWFDTACGARQHSRDVLHQEEIVAHPATSTDGRASSKVLLTAVLDNATRCKRSSEDPTLGVPPRREGRSRFLPSQRWLGRASAIVSRGSFISMAGSPLRLRPCEWSRPSLIPGTLPHTGGSKNVSGQ